MHPGHVMVAVAGMAALAWELLWQIQASLALGVSAKGTAITLAATMGGMSAGSFLAGRLLHRHRLSRPLRAYGLCELVIGVSGLLMLAGFRLLMGVDSALYARAPAVWPLIHLLGMVLLLGPPTLAMGATLPLFGLIARPFHTTISRLYAVNTAGAALGVLLMSFVVLPQLGVTLSTRLAAVLNLAVCVASFRLSRGHGAEPQPPEAEAADPAPERMPAGAAPPAWSVWLTVFATGFVTFTLEVAWFRSLRAAFQNTTDSFAIILAAVLIPLAAGARLVPVLRGRRVTVGHMLAAAGAAVLLATPMIERFDLLMTVGSGYWRTLSAWLGWSLLAMGVPILLLGTVLPWLLDEQAEPGRWGALYALNTVGAIAGAVLAAWLLLPALGFARTAWLAGGLVVALALVMNRGRARWAGAAAGAAALAIAVASESGLGRERIQGETDRTTYRVLAYAEAPDSTISVIEFRNSFRALVIDGFQAASERASAHYMEWMGRLPMLLHPAPRRALVIAFGTGQTANGVRREGPAQLDVVELSPEVMDLAGYFESNENVLADPRVETIIMDGRAWLRRTDRRYDVVTLEPMPPHFAGVNALYCLEFYQLMAARLNPGAIVAQWVPYHLLPPEYALHVSATFRQVFPDSILWVDPPGKTGILLGRHGGGPGRLGDSWPGLQRGGAGRDLDARSIREAVRLDVDGLGRYAEHALLITDDNQRLAYGDVRRQQLCYGASILDANLDLVERMAARE